MGQLVNEALAHIETDLMPTTSSIIKPDHQIIGILKMPLVTVQISAPNGDTSIFALAVNRSNVISKTNVCFEAGQRCSDEIAVNRSRWIISRLHPK